MTPSKKGKVTHIKIERKKKQYVNPEDVVHVAGGQHQGLVVARPGMLFGVFFNLDYYKYFNLQYLKYIIMYCKLNIYNYVFVLLFYLPV